MPFGSEEEGKAGKGLLHDTHFDFSNSAIIKPNQQGFDKGREVLKKYHPIVIDSRDRNISRFPEPSKYVIDLDDQIEDVIAAELVVANIPVKQYVVNDTNDAFACILDDTTELVIRIPHGNYAPEQLAVRLKQELDRKTTGQEVRIQYDALRDKFSFQSSDPFRLDFEKRTTKAYPFNMGKLLGFPSRIFDAKLDADDSQFKIEAPYRKNFEETNYALLKITGFNVYKSDNQMIDRTFAVIPFQRLDQNIASEVQTIRKDFNPPIPRLSKLQISFVDRNGNPIDFQNHDHYFIIRLESFKNTRKYSSFVDM